MRVLGICRGLSFCVVAVSAATFCSTDSDTCIVPFARGVVRFCPWGMPPGHAGVILYENACLQWHGRLEVRHSAGAFWRLFFCGGCGMRAIVGDREVELDGEHVGLIPASAASRFVGKSTAAAMWLSFNVSRCMMPETPLPVRLRLSETERSLFDELVRVFMKADEAADRERIFHGSMALLHAMMHRPEIPWQSRIPAVVLQTIQHIERHYASPLPVARLARMADLGVATLTRLFKESQGETLSRFIVKVRVREASHMLAHTDVAIDDIATRTGFPSREYLSRVFKRITGLSPAEFRRQQSGGFQPSCSLAHSRAAAIARAYSPR